MNQLLRELRNLLTETRGNSHVEVRVKHLIAALCAADEVLERASSR